MRTCPKCAVVVPSSTARCPSCNTPLAGGLRRLWLVLSALAVLGVVAALEFRKHRPPTTGAPSGDESLADSDIQIAAHSTYYLATQIKVSGTLCYTVVAGEGPVGIVLEPIPPGLQPPQDLVESVRERQRLVAAHGTGEISLSATGGHWYAWYVVNETDDLTKVHLRAVVRRR